MINTIVTGGNGFIGSHLLERIRGFNLPHEEIHYSNSWDFKKVFFLSTYGNMAWHTSPEQMMRANVQDLLTIINGFTGWICYMSSSSVLLPVQTPYSRTKRAAEEILQALPGLKSCIVRPYSVTGVGEQKEHLIPTLISSCMEGEEMPFDPWPVHDFIDVEDVVDGLIRLADDQATGIYEFGNGIPVTNQQVKEIVETACGKKANVKVTRHIRPYDSTAWFCLRPHFKPKKSLRKSIEEMVEAYRERA